MKLYAYNGQGRISVTYSGSSVFIEVFEDDRTTEFEVKPLEGQHLTINREEIRNV